MIKIAIFASGNGTNAQRITEYFGERQGVITVDLILSNKKDAFVLERAKKLGVTSMTFSRQEFYESASITDLLKDHAIEYIVLAGFLWLVLDSILKAFPDRILNIHPALLPKYGGNGMFGMKVHEAVIASHDKESGITIHLVNERYDEGQILFQAKCIIGDSDTPVSLAEKIHALEYNYYPQVIENFILKDTSLKE